jgi:hypothetical protein
MIVSNYQINSFHNFVHINPLAAIKADSCCRIRNVFIETSLRKVLLSILYMHSILQRFVVLTIFDIVLYVLYIIQGHYSPILRALL